MRITLYLALLNCFYPGIAKININIPVCAQQSSTYSIVFTAMQESFYIQEQGLKADLQTAALPMESASSGDTQRKLLCFLISAPLLPIPTVSTLAPFLVSPPTSSNLVAHGLMGCPRCPNCLSWPLPRHLPAGLASDH